MLGAGPVPKYQGRFRETGVSLSSHRALNQLCRSLGGGATQRSGGHPPRTGSRNPARPRGRVARSAGDGPRLRPGVLRTPARAEPVRRAVSCRARSVAAGPRSTEPAADAANVDSSLSGATSRTPRWTASGNTCPAKESCPGQGLSSPADPQSCDTDAERSPLPPAWRKKAGAV